MTQRDEKSKKVMEFNSLFLNLDEREQDQMLVVLRSLEYAQSVTGLRKDRRLPAVKKVT